jgi:threonine dehydrogenase-like Zn-dependent dehydrogenase
VKNQIPDWMSAAVFEAVDVINIRKIPVPTPKDGEALIKIKACGLCITDVHVIKGTFEHSEPPCVLGHEIAGEIIDFGKLDVKTKHKIGDRVVVETMIACGICDQCIKGYKNLCEYGKDLGEPPNQGGYSEYITVPIGNLYHIPDNMSYEEAAIFESFVCPVGGLQRIGVTMSDVVLIQGLGPAGLAFVQAAKIMGASIIIVSDLDENRLELAKRYGADVCVNIKKENLASTVMMITDGLGADISIEASGNETAIHESLNLCKKNGKVIFYGIPNDKHNARFDVTQVILKQLNLYGTSGAPWAWKRTLELYGQGKFNIKDMVTHTFPLVEINKGIETLLNPESNAIKIVLYP